MCYLIAKDFNKQGCMAVKTRHGKALSEIVNDLNAAVADKGIQLVTISRPSAYGEYEPYEIIADMETFRTKVIASAM